MTHPDRRLKLCLLPQRFVVCRLAPEALVPDWALRGAFFSVTRTLDEVSIIVDEKQAPPDVQSQHGFRALQVAGPLQFDEIGILAALTNILAGSGISILSISTFDTDYLFVRDSDLAAARKALTAKGHTIEARSQQGTDEQQR